MLAARVPAVAVVAGLLLAVQRGLFVVARAARAFLLLEVLQHEVRGVGKVLLQEGEHSPELLDELGLLRGGHVGARPDHHQRFALNSASLRHR